jgi:hypothetical protein
MKYSVNAVIALVAVATLNVADATKPLLIRTEPEQEKRSFIRSNVRRAAGQEPELLEIDEAELDSRFLQMSMSIMSMSMGL